MKDKRRRNIFRSGLSSPLKPRFLYWASEYILGGFADMPNVSMDSDYFWIHRHFYYLVCFCVWLSKPARHEARRYTNAQGNAVSSGFTTPTVDLTLRLTVKMAFG